MRNGCIRLLLCVYTYFIKNINGTNLAYRGLINPLLADDMLKLIGLLILFTFGLPAYRQANIIMKYLMYKSGWQQATASGIIFSTETAAKIEGDAPGKNLLSLSAKYNRILLLSFRLPIEGLYSCWC